MSEVYNFSAGPAMLPAAVLERAQQELRDWHGSGMSIMEVSHRGAQFAEVAEQSVANLRALLKLPDNFSILFMQGGATTQFAAVPLNLLGPGERAAYVNTGSWSTKAIAEARRYGEVEVVADAASSNFSDIPAQQDWAACDSAAYLHYTSNETIGGVEFQSPPEVAVPLVSDMSSNFLSRPLDVSQHAVVYAGAQKNIGPAGLTVVLVRQDVLERGSRQAVPRTLDYVAMSKAGSMLNTPPTFAWYVAGLVFEWLLSEGGLTTMAKRNDAKAERLYGYIDESGFYTNPVAKHCRSRMNIPFVLADPELDSTFLAESAKQGLLNLKGHRSVGGMRASIYNAMPMAGVDELISFMQDFQKRYG